MTFASVALAVKIQQINCLDSDHLWVDLGLPSGLKWATCNLGANSPSECGNYYSWGAIKTQLRYYIDDCKTHGKSMGDIGGDSDYDAARYKLGEPWRMPTINNFVELKAECQWIWSKYNGKDGYIIRSKNNGNCIFLPVSGQIFGDHFISSSSRTGYYWSSTPNNHAIAESYYLMFDKNNYSCKSAEARCTGLCIRPVKE